MRTAMPSSTAVDEGLVGDHLPGWDYADAYAVGLEEGQPPSAGEAARDLLRPSRAGSALLRARDLAVRPWGIAPVGTGLAFPVLHEDADLTVLGLDDRHLDFRLLVQVGRGHVVCTTAVRRHGAAGRLYFAVVRPFHRRLVPRLLRSAARRSWSA